MICGLALAAYKYLLRVRWDRHPYRSHQKLQFAICNLHLLLQLAVFSVDSLLLLISLFPVYQHLSSLKRHRRPREYVQICWLIFFSHFSLFFLLSFPWDFAIEHSLVAGCYCYLCTDRKKRKQLVSNYFSIFIY